MERWPKFSREQKKVACMMTSRTIEMFILFDLIQANMFQCSHTPMTMNTNLHSFSR